MRKLTTTNRPSGLHETQVKDPKYAWKVSRSLVFETSKVSSTREAGVLA